MTEAFLAAAGYWGDKRRHDRLIDMRVSQGEADVFKTLIQSLKD